ncbi:MAG: MarR family winged helix-turn-helix transcriptional regulator [Gammaproteobacteria bacterium]
MVENTEQLAAALTTNGSDEDWAIRLGFYIHDASRLRRIVYDTALRPLGVTRSQAWVIAYLSRQDGMPQSDLAAQLDLGKVALGGLVDRLEATSLVERRPDAADRRIKRIFLTAEGRKVVTRMRKIAAATNAVILHGIPPAEVKAAAQTLRTVKANLLKMVNGDPGGDEE